jgi:hypothetical protein
MKHEITYERLDAAIIAHEEMTPANKEAIREAQWALVAGGMDMDDAFVVAIEAR